MKIQNLVAIDTHVHVESELAGNAAGEAAPQIFRQQRRLLQPQGSGRILPLAQDRMRGVFGG